MEHPSKRRRIERNLGGAVEGLNQNSGRDGAVSVGGSSPNEKPIMPKLVLPPHGAPGHPAHGDHIIDTSSRGVDHPHYPLESTDTKPTRIHARQIVQPSATDPTVLASGGTGNVPEPRTSEATSRPSATPTSTAEDNFYPGEVVPPAAVAAANARNQALESQQAQAQSVDVKQLDAIPQASATAPAAPATPAVASASQKALPAPNSSSQQIVKAPSTPPPSSSSPTAESSASYFSASPASSPSPSPQRISSPSPPLPTFTSSKYDFTINRNSTLPASTTTSSNPSKVNTNSGTVSASLFALPTASQTSLPSISAIIASISDATNPSASPQNLPSETGSQQITATPSTRSTSVSTPGSSQLSSQASFASVVSSASVAGAGGNVNSGNTTPTPQPSSSSTSSPGGSSAPPTQDLVGGIVGGVAGLAMIFVILLLLFRWRQGKLGNRRTIAPPAPHTVGHGGEPQSGNVTQRSSTAPIAAAGFFRSLRPASSQTATTADTVPSSERGFQKISGRKLPSVLASGGDGWGDPPAAGPVAESTGGAAGLSMAAGAANGRSPFDDPPPGQRPSPPQSLSGSSFYRDSHGFYGGVVPEEQTEASSSPRSSSSPTYFAPLGAATGRSNVPLGQGSPSRRDEAAQMRPGPARTPVINQPGFGSVRGGAPPRPVRATPPPAGLHPVRDGLGRSHPSQDGSRGSRFREDTTPP